MTRKEIVKEREYRIQERLGILCGDQMPTLSQRFIAEQEADEWEKSLNPQAEMKI